MFTPVDTAVNIGSAHIQGVETELTLRLSNWLTLQASYTFTDAQNADTGSRLLRRPQNTAAFDATITPLPGLTIAPELLLTGAFQDFLVDDGGNATGTIVSSPHGLIANLTVTYDVAPHVQLYANGRNLFYSRFEPVNGFQTPGPSFLAGVRVQTVDRRSVMRRAIDPPCIATHNGSLLQSINDRGSSCAEFCSGLSAFRSRHHPAVSLPRDLSLSLRGVSDAAPIGSSR